MEGSTEAPLSLPAREHKEQIKSPPLSAKGLEAIAMGMDGPDSSYSGLEIPVHICWDVDKEAKMGPPI